MFDLASSIFASFCRVHIWFYDAFNVVWSMTYVWLELIVFYCTELEPNKLQDRASFICLLISMNHQKVYLDKKNHNDKRKKLLKIHGCHCSFNFVTFFFILFIILLNRYFFKRYAYDFGLIITHVWIKKYFNNKWK